MELNTRGRYAVMAMADLAKYGADGSLPLPAIAERQQISLAYLEQLFLKLRRAGLVESARGRSGGYRLGRPADAISVADVMAAVEEDTRMTRCGGEAAKPCMAGTALPYPRAVGCARRSDRLVPGKRDAAGGAGRHSGGKAGPASQPVAFQPGPHRSALHRVERGMSRTRTYLDCNATAPLRREARAAMVAALDVAGNPSSPHAEGRRARGVIEDAREQVAALVGARPAEVVFTSGGTEANNAVLAGRLGRDPASRHRARLGAGAGATLRGAAPRDPGRERWRRAS